MSTSIRQNTRWLPLLFLSFLLLSCREVIRYIDEPVNFSISSPRQNWTYYEDVKIMLSVNVNTHDIIWTSDISGYLGEGNHCTVFLSEGLHRISAEIQNVKKETYVNVLPIIIADGRSQTVLVNYSPLEIKLKKGSYYPFLYTNEGSVNNFQVSGVQVLSNNRNITNPVQAANRDIHLPMPQKGKTVTRAPVTARALGKTLYDADKRTFFVINTLNQYGLPHEIEAELFYRSDMLTVWVPVSDQIPDALISECIQTVETLIIPRIEQIWGKPADIDGDGRIAILFSHTLNNEGMAIGFFNPADFFERNNNTQSESYNPSSNEMDIMYVAIPDSGTSYSMENVLATIAHELTHASTFTVKTWSRIKNGNNHAEREELFLDEGWSHLTENLCGLGVSGGNIKFLNRFFENTSMYSFCGPNRNGLEDSAGMRGAITLFLSWLFWKSGGMSWDSSNPVTVIDRGGVSFLKRMVELPDNGWESIGIAYGKPVHLLFNEMLNEMNQYRKTGRSYTYKIDPVTKEAVDFFVNMGDIGGINIGFPASSSIYSSNTLLPWSFTFFDYLLLPADSLLALYADKNIGSIFYSY